jgi:hypothetical protein
VTERSRSSIRSTSVRPIKFKRVSRAVGAPATGTTASAFLARCEAGSCCRSVLWRPATYALGATPRETLSGAFYRLRKAAAATLFQRIAERLGPQREFSARMLRSTGPKEFEFEWVNQLLNGGCADWMASTPLRGRD